MIWVGGLPDGFSRSEIEETFDDFGAIANVAVSKAKYHNGSYTPGFAFIEFKKK